MYISAPRAQEAFARWFCTPDGQPRPVDEQWLQQEYRFINQRLRKRSLTACLVCIPVLLSAAISLAIDASEDAVGTLMVLSIPCFVFLVWYLPHASREADLSRRWVKFKCQEAQRWHRLTTSEKIARRAARGFEWATFAAFKAAVSIATLKIPGS